MSTGNIGNSNAAEDIDFNKLTLEERLHNKSWKGRLSGYHELIQVFNNAMDSDDIAVRKYWNDPTIFDKFILDNNVVAQEQSVIALEALVSFMKPLTNDLGNRSQKLLSVWIPSLIEKGLGSSRPHTRETALNCIVLLCSLDNSIENTIELALPLLEKKLPRLLSSTLNVISKLIITYSFTNIKNLIVFLNKLFEPIPKLASHADKNVRAESINLILQTFILLHNDSLYGKFLQDFINDNLKSIQQRELSKLFESESQNPTKNSMNFIQFEEIKRQNESSTKSKTDEDGDTIMFSNENVLNNNKLGYDSFQDNIDPYTLLPIETILDKTPEEFYERVKSTKWKDRVEALEEFYDNCLTKVKRIDPKADYSNLLSIYANIISKDVNLQAVTFASESIEQIFDKLKKPDLTKNYCLIVFNALLLRTKEKKITTIEPICNCLKLICNNYNPLIIENEDLLIDILMSMKNKIPQIRLESTKILTYLLQNMNDMDKKSLMKKLNHENDQESITSIVLKIVNDTQPAMRNVGFECMATLVKLFGQRYFNQTLENLDNIKKHKIMELVETLAPINSVDQSKIIPSKRGPPQRIFSNSTASPFKRSNASNINEENSLRNIKLTKFDENISTADEKIMPPRKRTSLNESYKPEHNALLERLKKDNQILNEEKHNANNTISQLQKENDMLLIENKNLKEEKNLLQNELNDKELNLKEKVYEINKLTDKANNLEKEVLSLKENQNVSNHGRKLSDASSSDDLRRRVDSLRLNSSIESVASSNLNLNFGVNKAHDGLLTINNDNEESWKRAAEVTRMLKARIEKMRARNK